MKEKIKNISCNNFDTKVLDRNFYFSMFNEIVRLKHSHELTNSDSKKS